MKILFINPSISVESEELWATSLKLDLFGKMSFVPRLAPMMLAAVTPKEYSFTYLDEDLEDIKFDQIDADLIALTGMTVQATRAYELADKFREMGYPVVMGGIHASSCPEEAALHVDAICIGEGENYWPILLEDFSKGQLKKVYRSTDYKAVTNVPMPKVDIVNHTSYSVLPLQATRGCPYSCDFCCIEFSSGRKYRKKPVEQVVAEIKELSKHNTGPVTKRYHFMDDNLYVNRNYTIELFKAIIPLNIQWMGMGSLNIIQDEEVLSLIAQSGCRSFSIGFESISEENLKVANKDKTNSIEEYKIAAKKLTEHGIIPSGYFIFGFDHDDEESFARTVKFTKENRIINPYFNILTPFPGTPLYRRIENKIFDYNWSHYGSLKCVFNPEKLSAKQLEVGSYGASFEVAKIDLMKDHMQYFWSHGPWEKNPKLKFRERLFLILISLTIWKQTESRRFLMWAATKRNATDMYQVIATAGFYHAALKFLDLRDSALEALNKQK